MDATEYDLMDAVEDSLWWYRAMHARVAAALDRPWPRALPLLDAGCGTGGFLQYLAAARPGIVTEGVEYHPPAADRARAKTGRPIAVGSINDLPYEDGAFGAVVSLDVLCHRAVDLDRALRELRRVLAPGGLLVLNLPAFDWMRSVHDERVHTARRFVAGRTRAMLAEAGFGSVRARYWNTLLLPLMIVHRKILSRSSDQSDVAPVHPVLDRGLHAVTSLERRLATLGVPMPAGGSLLATASA